MLTRFTLLGLCGGLLLAQRRPLPSQRTSSCGDGITQDTTLDSDLVNCPGIGW